MLTLLAATLAGECGDIGQGCEVAVAQTMARRVETPGFPPALADVVTDYYGRAKPTMTSYGAAWLLLTAPQWLGSGEYLYAYSDDDCRTQGWRRGDTMLCREGRCIHFASAWPGG